MGFFNQAISSKVFYYLCDGVVADNFVPSHFRVKLDTMKIVVVCIFLLISFAFGINVSLLSLLLRVYFHQTLTNIWNHVLLRFCFKYLSSKNLQRNRMTEVAQMNCHKIRTWWWKCLSGREMLCLTLMMKTY